MTPRRIALAALIAAVPVAFAADPKPDPAADLGFDPYDQSAVPLEVGPPAGFTGKKIVLVAGRKSHGPGDHEFFAGTAILMDLLKQNPGVWPVMVRDGWPKDESVFDGADALVFYMDGRGGHPVSQGDHLKTLQPLIDNGVGWVNMHYAVDYTPEAGETVVGWLGGYYDARISTNPHWDAAIRSLPKHPICRGVDPFTIRDEWYFNMHWVGDVPRGEGRQERDADPPGDPAGPRPGDGRREEVPRPDGNAGLGLRAEGRRPVVRVHRRAQPPQLGGRGLPPGGDERDPLVGQGRGARRRGHGEARPGRPEPQPRPEGEAVPDRSSRRGSSVKRWWPGESLIGPLAGWELVRLARRGQAHRSRQMVVYLVAVGFILLPILWFPWADPVGLFVDGGQTLRPAEAARFAERFALVVIETILLAVVLMAPAYAAVSLAEEKARNTLLLLRTTDLSDREIVLGKAVGRLVFVARRGRGRAARLGRDDAVRWCFAGDDRRKRAGDRARRPRWRRPLGSGRRPRRRTSGRR